MKQKVRHVDDPVMAGRRLREARERAGLTQEELAGNACTSSYVSRLELGDRTPSLQLLRQLATQLDVTADYLATGVTGASAVEEPLRDAEIALRLDELDTARRLYKGALSVAGTDGPAALERGRLTFAAKRGLGLVALREGRYAEAVELLESALETSPIDPLDEPEIAESLARAYGATGRSSQAIALLARYLHGHDATADLLQYVRFASLLGYALADSGDLAGAERVVAQALARGRDAVDPRARARIYWSESRLLAEQARPRAAERYARRTLETLRVTEDNHSIAQAIEMLADVCLQLGRAGEALELLDRGQPIVDSVGSRPGAARYKLARARVLSALGEREQAASLAMQLADEAGDIEPTAGGREYLCLATLLDELDRPDRAQELYERAISSLEEHPPSKHLVAAHRALAELLKRQGNRDTALDLLERAIAIQTEVGNLGDASAAAMTE